MALFSHFLLRRGAFLILIIASGLIITELQQCRADDSQPDFPPSNVKRKETVKAGWQKRQANSGGGFWDFWGFGNNREEAASAAWTKRAEGRPQVTTAKAKVEAVTTVAPKTTKKSIAVVQTTAQATKKSEITTKTVPQVTTALVKQKEQVTTTAKKSEITTKTNPQSTTARVYRDVLKYVSSTKRAVVGVTSPRAAIKAALTTTKKRVVATTVAPINKVDNHHGHHRMAPTVPNTTTVATEELNSTTTEQVASWGANEALISEKDLSSCYSAVTFGILQKKNGRIDVTERETAQFSLDIDRNRAVGDCSMVWVKIFIEDIDGQDTSTLVDSNMEIFEPTTTKARIVGLPLYSRFPTRNFVRGVFLGYANLHFQALNKTINTTAKDFNASLLPADQWITFASGKVATFREQRGWDIVFQIVIFCLIICGNIGIGLDVNWKDIRAVIVRPIGPVIGFCSQYIVMPLTAFAVVKLIDLPPSIALGVFLIGCAPGGGGSNYHTYFLGGNLPLSVTMTFVSTCAAIGMMPLWVFTLGRLVLNESQTGVKIDFKGILGSLCTSVIPFVIGIFVNWRRPALAKRIFRHVVRPLLFCIFVYLITIGLFTNLYLFRLMQPKVLLAGICLPYVGFTLGFVIAMIAKQGRSIAVTIAIETGIQSTGVAITTLILSLPQPDADIAIVGPLAVTMFTPIPLWIAEICRGIYMCIKKKRCFVFDPCIEQCNKKDDDVEEQDSGDDEKLPANGEEVTSFNSNNNNNNNNRPESQLPLLNNEDGSASADKKPKDNTTALLVERSLPLPHHHHIQQSHHHQTPADRDSALQPLLESASYSDDANRSSALTESDTSTLVPVETFSPPAPVMQSSQPADVRKSSSASSASSKSSYDELPESIEQTVVRQTRPGLQQDPRSIESLYIDAEE